MQAFADGATQRPATGRTRPANVDIQRCRRYSSGVPQSLRRRSRHRGRRDSRSPSSPSQNDSGRTPAIHASQGRVVTWRAPVFPLASSASRCSPSSCGLHTRIRERLSTRSSAPVGEHNVTARTYLTIRRMRELEAELSGRNRAVIADVDRLSVLEWKATTSSALRRQ